VLVDIPKDVLQNPATYSWPPTLDLPGYHPTLHPHGKQIREAARMIVGAKRPVLYVGGGVLKAKASEELRRLAELTGCPVVTTLMALGAFPDSHEQHLGMPGMHGTVPAVLALQEADLLVSLGARFDDRVTGKAALFAPHAKVVHVDIDPAEISKIRTADVPIVGDLKDVLVDLEAAYRAAATGAKPDIAEWWSFLDGLRDEFPLGYTQPSDGLMSPQYVIQRIGELTGPEGVYAAGVGQHQMWAAQFIKYQRPNSWLNSGGLGTMGYAVPAAMGAKVGDPSRTVWAIDGDGCFQMTNQELATCTINEIPIKVAIINNSSLGMVRQWQTLFYESRYSNTDLNTGHGTVRIPDFVKMADAYGCAGLRCETVADVDATIKRALEINDQPVVIDFTVSRDAMVWPMVAAGVSNDQIQYARGISPAWDREE
jgi:acetolactate synthase-1/2/3 large subunit